MGKLAARRADRAPLAGKSTLNRLQRAGRGADALPQDRPRRGLDRAAVRRAVPLSHRTPPAEIVLDLTPPTTRCTAARGRFFHGYYGCYCYLPLYVFCGDHLLVAKLRPSDIDASAGAVEAVARLVGQLGPLAAGADPPAGRQRLRTRRADGLAEQHRVDYVLGLARNSRLVARSPPSCRRDSRGRADRPASPLLQGLPLSDPRQLELRAPGGRQSRAAGRRCRRAEPQPALRGDQPRRRGWPPRALYEQPTAPAATWRTASRNASSTCSRTAPRPAPCGPPLRLCSPRSPTCCSRPAPDRAAGHPACPAAGAIRLKLLKIGALVRVSVRRHGRHGLPPPRQRDWAIAHQALLARQADHDPDSAQSTSLDATLPACATAPTIPRQPYPPPPRLAEPQRSVLNWRR